MKRHEQSVVLSGATLQTPLAEAYRALRANVSFAAIGHGVRAILVTSGAPGEGKSTTVANLAILLAQAGSRVIMVDADFRRPHLRHLFPANGSGPHAAGVEALWQRNDGEPVPLGLSSLIAGSATFLEAAVPVEGFDNLWLLPTGTIPPNPSELISSPRMREVLADLRDRADVVLLDSPPSSVYADAVELTQVTDGVLYVLKSGEQRHVNHERILKQLQQGQARLLGVVLNQVEVGVAGYDRAYGGGAKARG